MVEITASDHPPWTTHVQTHVIWIYNTHQYFASLWVGRSSLISLKSLQNTFYLGSAMNDWIWALQRMTESGLYNEWLNLGSTTNYWIWALQRMTESGLYNEWLCLGSTTNDWIWAPQWMTTTGLHNGWLNPTISCNGRSQVECSQKPISVMHSL